MQEKVEKRKFIIKAKKATLSLFLSFSMVLNILLPVFSFSEKSDKKYKHHLKLPTDSAGFLIAQNDGSSTGNNENCPAVNLNALKNYVASPDFKIKLPDPYATKTIENLDLTILSSLEHSLLNRKVGWSLYGHPTVFGLTYDDRGNFINVNKSDIFTQYLNGIPSDAIKKDESVVLGGFLPYVKFNKSSDELYAVGGDPRGENNKPYLYSFDISNGDGSAKRSKDTFNNHYYGFNRGLDITPNGWLLLGVDDLGTLTGSWKEEAGASITVKNTVRLSGFTKNYSNYFEVDSKSSVDPNFAFGISAYILPDTYKYSDVLSLLENKTASNEYGFTLFTVNQNPLNSSNLSVSSKLSYWGSSLESLLGVSNPKIAGLKLYNNTLYVSYFINEGKNFKEFFRDNYTKYKNQYGEWIDPVTGLPPSAFKYTAGKFDTRLAAFKINSSSSNISLSKISDVSTSFDYPNCKENSYGIAGPITALNDVVYVADKTYAPVIRAFRHDKLTENKLVPYSKPYVINTNTPLIKQIINSSNYEPLGGDFQVLGLIASITIDPVSSVIFASIPFLEKEKLASNKIHVNGFLSSAYISTTEDKCTFLTTSETCTIDDIKEGSTSGPLKPGTGTKPNINKPKSKIGSATNGTLLPTAVIDITDDQAIDSNGTVYLQAVEGLNSIKLNAIQEGSNKLRSYDVKLTNKFFPDIKETFLDIKDSGGSPVRSKSGSKSIAIGGDGKFFILTDDKKTVLVDGLTGVAKDYSSIPGFNPEAIANHGSEKNNAVVLDVNSNGQENVIYYSADGIQPLVQNQFNGDSDQSSVNAGRYTTELVKNKYNSLKVSDDEIGIAFYKHNLLTEKNDLREDLINSSQYDSKKMLNAYKGLTLFKSASVEDVATNKLPKSIYQNFYGEKLPKDLKEPLQKSGKKDRYIADAEFVRFPGDDSKYILFSVFDTGYLAEENIPEDKSLTLINTDSQEDKFPKIANPELSPSYPIGEPITIYLFASDPNKKSGNRVVSINKIELPEWAKLSFNSSQELGTISGTPPSTGVYVISLDAVNNLGYRSSPLTFSINVSENIDNGVVNNAPTVEPIDDVTVNDRSNIEIDVKAFDSEGDSLKYYAENLPQGIKINENTGKISGVLDFICDKEKNTRVVKTIRTFVSDGEKSSNIEEFKITINDVNNKPFLKVPSNQNAYFGKDFSLRLEATDKDKNDSVTCLTWGLPPGLEINNCTISGIPKKVSGNTQTKYSVRSYAYDNHVNGYSALGKFEISVSDPISDSMSVYSEYSCLGKYVYYLDGGVILPTAYLGSLILTGGGFDAGEGDDFTGSNDVADGGSDNVGDQAGADGDQAGANDGSDGTNGDNFGTDGGNDDAPDISGDQSGNTGGDGSNDGGTGGDTGGTVGGDTGETTGGDDSSGNDCFAGMLCSSDAQCGMGFCIGGACACFEPNCKQGMSCTANADCGNGQCLSESCVCSCTPETAETACSDGKFCTNDRCNNGLCKNSPVICPEPDERCFESSNNYICAECLENSHCPMGSVCLRNKCLPDAPGDGCSTNEDCDDNNKCTTDECLSTGDCSHVTLHCMGGQSCCPLDGACHECCSDSDCAQGEECTNFACVPRDECENDDDCEGETPYCYSGLENKICVQCFQYEHCDDNKECTTDYCHINFQCKHDLPPPNTLCNNGMGICQPDGECEAKECDSVNDCFTSNECKHPETCSNGMCMFGNKPDGTLCSMGICTNGNCSGMAEGCNSDSDCSSGEKCCNSSCVKANCCNDAQCSGNQSCLNYYCSCENFETPSGSCCTKLCATNPNICSDDSACCDGNGYYDSSNNFICCKNRGGRCSFPENACKNDDICCDSHPANHVPTGNVCCERCPYSGRESICVNDIQCVNNACSVPSVLCNGSCCPKADHVCFYNDCIIKDSNHGINIKDEYIPPGVQIIHNNVGLKSGDVAVAIVEENGSNSRGSNTLDHLKSFDVYLNGDKANRSVSYSGTITRGLSFKESSYIQLPNLSVNKAQLDEWTLEAYFKPTDNITNEVSLVEGSNFVVFASGNSIGIRDKDHNVSQCLKLEDKDDKFYSVLDKYDELNLLAGDDGGGDGGGNTGDDDDRSDNSGSFSDIFPLKDTSTASLEVDVKGFYRGIPDYIQIAVGSISYTAAVLPSNSGVNFQAKVLLDPKEGNQPIDINAFSAGGTKSVSTNVIYDITPPDLSRSTLSIASSGTYNLNVIASDALSKIIKIVANGKEIYINPQKEINTSLQIQDSTVELKAIDAAGNIRTINLSIGLLDDGSGDGYGNDGSSGGGNGDQGGDGSSNDGSDGSNGKDDSGDNGGGGDQGGNGNHGEFDEITPTHTNQLQVKLAGKFIGDVKSVKSLYATVGDKQFTLNKELDGPGYLFWKGDVVLQNTDTAIKVVELTANLDKGVGKHPYSIVYDTVPPDITGTTLKEGSGSSKLYKLRVIANDPNGLSFIDKVIANGHTNISIPQNQRGKSSVNFEVDTQYPELNLEVYDAAGNKSQINLSTTGSGDDGKDDSGDDKGDDSGDDSSDGGGDNSGEDGKFQNITPTNNSVTNKPLLEIQGEYTGIADQITVEVNGKSYDAEIKGENPIVWKANVTLNTSKVKNDIYVEAFSKKESVADEKIIVLYDDKGPNLDNSSITKSDDKYKITIKASDDLSPIKNVYLDDKEINIPGNQVNKLFVNIIEFIYTNKTILKVLDDLGNTSVKELIYDEGGSDDGKDDSNDDGKDDSQDGTDGSSDDGSDDSSDQGGSGDDYYEEDEVDDTKYEASNNVCIIANKQFKKDQWSHVVIRANGNSIQVFQDGELVAINNAYYVDLSSLTLGGSKKSKSFPGDIAQFRFYTRPLSLKEIRMQTAFTPRPANPEGLSYWLQMFERAGQYLTALRWKEGKLVAPLEVAKLVGFGNDTREHPHNSDIAIFTVDINKNNPSIRVVASDSSNNITDRIVEPNESLGGAAFGNDLNYSSINGNNQCECSGDSVACEEGFKLICAGEAICTQKDNDYVFACERNGEKIINDYSLIVTSIDKPSDSSDSNHSRDDYPKDSNGFIRTRYLAEDRKIEKLVQCPIYRGHYVISGGQDLLTGGKTDFLYTETYALLYKVIENDNGFDLQKVAEIPTHSISTDACKQIVRLGTAGNITFDSRNFEAFITDVHGTGSAKIISLSRSAIEIPSVAKRLSPFSKIVFIDGKLLEVIPASFETPVITTYDINSLIASGGGGSNSGNNQSIVGSSSFTQAGERIGYSLITGNINNAHYIISSTNRGRASYLNFVTIPDSRLKRGTGSGGDPDDVDLPPVDTPDEISSDPNLISYFFEDEEKEDPDSSTTENPKPPSDENTEFVNSNQESGGSLKDPNINDGFIGDECLCDRQCPSDINGFKSCNEPMKEEERRKGYVCIQNQEGFGRCAEAKELSKAGKFRPDGCKENEGRVPQRMQGDVPFCVPTHENTMKFEKKL